MGPGQPEFPDFKLSRKTGAVQYEKTGDDEYYFTGHVKGDDSRDIRVNAVFMTGLFPS